MIKNRGRLLYSSTTQQLFDLRIMAATNSLNLDDSEAESYHNYYEKRLGTEYVKGGLKKQQMLSKSEIESAVD